MEISKNRPLWMYERMRLIREFEQHLHEDFAAGNIPGFVHLYAGEEAGAVGMCANLKEDDFITSTHRGHGHCIAKGVQVTSMLAEIHGKATDIATLAATQAMEFLLAPVKLVTAPHTSVPFSAVLEDTYIPTPQRVVAAVRSVLEKPSQATSPVDSRPR